MRYMKTTTRKLSIFGGLAALMAVASLGIAADAAPATGTVTGKVNGVDQKPVAGAVVKIVAELKGIRPDAPKDTAEPAAPKDDKKAKPKGLTATTDENGQFKIENVPAGTYTATATVKGVSKGKVNVTVSAGKTSDTTITMSPIKKKA